MDLCSSLFFELSYKALGEKTHPFSWKESYGHGANQKRIDIRVGWGWRRTSLEVSLQIKFPGSGLSLLSSAVIL